METRLEIKLLRALRQINLIGSTCTGLPRSRRGTCRARRPSAPPPGGLHSSTFRIEVSNLCAVDLVVSVVKTTQVELRSGQIVSPCLLRHRRLRLPPHLLRQVFRRQSGAYIRPRSQLNVSTFLCDTLGTFSRLMGHNSSTSQTEHNAAHEPKQLRGRMRSGRV